MTLRLLDQLLPPMVAPQWPQQPGADYRPATMPPAAPVRPRLQLTLADIIAPPPAADDVVDVAPSSRSELGRILAMPYVDAIGGAPDLTDELLQPGATPWPGRLKPVQNAALHQARLCRGLLAPIGVGGGKTLISALLPTVLGSRRTVLLVPPDLVDKTEREFEKMRRCWRMLEPSRFHVISYSRLSSPKTPQLLQDIGPDLVLADEAHALKRMESARTKRFLRFFKAFPATMFGPMSGTVTTQSLYDYWHLAKLALGTSGSPVPTHYGEVGVWDVVFGSMAMDARFAAQRSGARLALPGPESEYVARKLRSFAEPYVKDVPLKKDETENQRALRVRLTSSPGVVASSTLECNASLRLQLLRPAIPDELQKLLAHLEATWELFDDELEDAMAYARVARQLCAGFAYRWVWPGGKKDEAWLDARKVWHSGLRGYLSGMGKEGYDSPALVAGACDRKDPKVRALWDFREKWLPFRHQFPAPRRTPPVETIWVDEFLVRAAIEAAGKDAIIWFASDALEDAYRRAGLEMFGPGEDASVRLNQLAEDVLEGRQKTRTIACKIGPHHKGKNLQGWRRMVVCEPPTSGAIWEQMLGRLHRQGQKADEVECSVFVHGAFGGALEAGLQSARYQEGTIGKPQLLLVADIVDGANSGVVDSDP